MTTYPSHTRRTIFAWTLFDFANTAFYVVVLTVGYPTYFREVVAGNTPDADLLWSVSFSSSMFLVALLSPVLGAAADSGVGKKRFLASFTALCIAATAALFFVEGSMVLMGMLLLILANVGFEAGLVFYDAFLPELTTERSYGRVSGYGFAMGYVGSLAMLLIVYPLYEGGFDAANLTHVRSSFAAGALFFLLFSLPLFALVPDRQKRESVAGDILATGLRRVRSTFREISRYRNIARFLLAYFVYIDGVNTIIVFSAIYARETLEFGLGEIVVFFALVQTAAMAGAAFFGVLADHFGQKKMLTVTLVLWLVVVAAAYGTTEKDIFYAIGALAGVALGSSQSISRSLMSLLTPAEKKTEFFGFFSFFGKASAIIGPLVFGIVSASSGQRLAIVSIGFFLITGLVLLQFVEAPLPVRTSLSTDSTKHPSSSRH
jgi:UMF1 family MFS transporter